MVTRRDELYPAQEEVLHNLDYEAISATVAQDTAGTVDQEGRKILPAGTLVTGVDSSLFDDRRQLATQTDGAAGAEGEAPVVDGVTLYDVDLTHDNATVAVVYVGTVKANKLQVELTPEIRNALPRIQFVNAE